MFLAYDDTQRVHLLRKDMRNGKSCKYVSFLFLEARECDYGISIRLKLKGKLELASGLELVNAYPSLGFGAVEESSLGDGLGEGHGMLGQAGSGKLRISVGQNKLAAKVAKKFKERSFGSGATSGLTSVFQLRAPAARAPKPRTPKPQLHLWVLERAGEKRAAEEREAALEAAAEREAALEVEWERQAEWDMEAEWERQ
ncbi:hypothetical protein POM88_037162 [Heracleum sosnowskyi]|uniref:Prp31 C-terminal domain-containing protein n=1 Tax=Heracleum sosnowskyi TaxID=360622 RepID=A0AAD8MD24_9APIA|nr:hypothetical protein POM88_037162 [Heracleum sosnowskyi]